MAKMRNSYDLDVDEAWMDEKIRILEKHHKIAEKQKMIAELENKNKKGHRSKKGQEASKT